MPMINFFRRTRKKMADDNRPLKYVRYAIGEIFLVVIGILLALQINTWNQQRLDQKEAHKILLRLKKEFQNNNELIASTIFHHSNRRNAAKILKKQFDPSHQISQDSLRILFLQLSSDWKYEPVKNIIESLVSTGRIDLIKNDSIQDDIRYWPSTIIKYNELYQSQDALFNSTVLPILIDNYPLLEFLPTDNSQFEANTEAIFSNLKNENIFFLFEFKVDILLNWTRHIQKLQLAALAKIEEELEQ